VHTSQQTTPPSDRKVKAAILSRLALHYWRPDFSPEQARMLMADYLDDLVEVSPNQLERACMEFRKKPESTFFPKIGELLAIINPAPQYPDIPPRRLPTFRSAPALTGPKPKLRSVAQVLRDTGHFAAADRWEIGRK